ncbi:MAG: hypothetical protein FJ309_03620 [Planctomycetes bacterium]|nr:hypothetical protein [Planctomycetota bacterium]
MGDEGLEQTTFSSGKQGVGPECSAFCSALSPDLALVVECWERLPDAVRAGMVAMVKATGG